MRRRLGIMFLSVAALGGWAGAAGPAYEGAPIHYSTTRPVDPVSRLQERVAAREVAIRGEGETGVLVPLLRELGVPVESQTLVFSKTSLQRNSISPSNPRAIYFNDDTYVGYVPGGRVIEIATTDPRIGTTFYTIDQRGAREGRLVRQVDNCLQCHASNMTRDVPGLMVRSVYADASGEPILSAGTFVTTHESPMNQRWGGWYVTSPLPGESMANAVFDGKEASAPGRLPALEPTKAFDARQYPSPHSDPVALLVLEHQVEAHNRLTRALYGTVMALRDEEVLRRAMGESVKEGEHSASTLSRIRSVCEPLVEYLLYCKEPALGGVVEGGTSFAKDFAARGPRDSKGRSLRDFDLRTRLFKYPLSYLIYSESFDALPRPALEYVYRRLQAVLTGEETGKAFAHLSAEDRRVILEIVRETKPEAAGYWK